MAKFAVGKNAWGISDRSGFRYLLREMRREWNGLLVGKDEFERKQPQLEPLRPPPEPQALKDPRPDTRSEPAVEQLLGLNAFLSGSLGSAVITVLEPAHGRTTGDIVRFRKAQGFDGFSSTVLEKADGYTITVVDSGSYTFTADSGTATAGSQRGGGENATVGPVTLEA
jgi:hypothetical protein